MDDRVFIAGLEASCVLGVESREREAPRRVVLDLELEADCSRAGASDDLADALDYAAVAAEVRRRTEASSFLLVEALAEHLATAVLEAFPRVTGLRLRVTKPGAVAGAAGVGVAIERRRELPHG